MLAASLLLLLHLRFNDHPAVAYRLLISRQSRTLPEPLIWLDPWILAFFLLFILDSSSHLVLDPTASRTQYAFTLVFAGGHAHKTLVPAR